jgi:hypothetical protein
MVTRKTIIRFSSYSIIFEDVVCEQATEGRPLESHIRELGGTFDKWHEMAVIDEVQILVKVSKAYKLIFYQQLALGSAKLFSIA